MRQQRPVAAAGRLGFTLVEMLVVLAILVVLASLGAAGIVRWIANQSQDTTETTMRGVYQVLNRQVKAVLDKADKENIPNSVYQMAGNDLRRARVIWKKLRLKQEFPMNYYEAWYPYAAANGVALLPAADLPAKKAYTNVLPKPATAPAYPPQAATPPAAPGPNESSICLLLALSQNRGGVRLSADDLPNIALSEDKTNPGGPKMIVDGWGLPLAFYRWPTGNTELIGLNTTKFADPLDPEGLLLNPNWYLTNGQPNPLRQQFESLCHAISPDGQRAYYVIPTLASAGRDITLGLDLTTMAVTNANVTADNIYSYRLRLGLRGSTQ